MKIRQFVPAGLLSILVCSLSLLYLYTSHQNKSGANIPKAGKHASNKYSFDEISFTEYADNGANKKFTINGKAMGVAPKRFGVFLAAPFKVLQITDPEIIFYTKNAQASILRAKKAIFDTQFNNEDYKNDIIKALSRRVGFTGGVCVTTEDRRALTCDNLMWDSAKGRFSANGRCVLTYEGKTVKGNSGETDVLLKDFSFRTDTKKRLKAPEKMFNNGGR